MSAKLEAFTKSCSTETHPGPPESWKKRARDEATCAALCAAFLLAWAFAFNAVVDRSGNCSYELNKRNWFFSEDLRVCNKEKPDAAH